MIIQAGKVSVISAVALSLAIMTFIACLLMKEAVSDLLVSKDDGWNLWDLPAIFIAPFLLAPVAASLFPKTILAAYCAIWITGAYFSGWPGSRFRFKSPWTWGIAGAGGGSMTALFLAISGTYGGPEMQSPAKEIVLVTSMALSGVVTAFSWRWMASFFFAKTGAGGQTGHAG
jgi:hypothetical protein